jgi:integrase
VYVWGQALIGCTVALTGRRRAEILGLTKAALKPEGFRVKDCKTKFGEPERHYLIEWSGLLHTLIAEVTAIKRSVQSIYLFATTDEGTPYTDAGFSCLWNRLMKGYAGDKSDPRWFTAHDLRALYVTEMLFQERDPKTHKNQQTMLDVYERSQVIKVSPLA